MNEERLVRKVIEAAFWLRERCIKEGWEWSDNLLRELVRCKYHEHFTNSISPRIYREAIHREPELGKWIKLGALKAS